MSAANDIKGSKSARKLLGALSPETLGGSPIQTVIEVEDADAIFQQALEHGAEELQAVIDRFYGKRAGQLKDPFGHHWTISMHIEDTTPEELRRRAQQMFADGY